MVELVKIGTGSTIDERENFLSDLNYHTLRDGILLQTCNRVEYYYGKGSVSDKIVQHLFRVVAGLESSIIGETAIVNQVKLAYYDAAKTRKLDKNLHRLFQTALFVGKRVRKETGISIGAISHGQAAVNLLFNKTGDFANLNITIIGVNALNEKIIKFLVSKGANTIFIGNRTFEKARELANKYNARALNFASLPIILEKTDVLISATSAPHFILKKENFHTKRKMIILDLAVPRDIDPGINDFQNVSLYDMERIEREIIQNIHQREDKVVLAEKIIEDEIEIFLNKMVGKNVQKQQ
jgi:glutamyl-tRNA reductase